MKLKFKVQAYQTNAVNDVVDCFDGQPMTSYCSIDPERFKNAELALSEEQILGNIQQVQRRQNLPVSQSLTDFTTFNNRGACVPVRTAHKRDALAATRFHLNVEMETGTGKTYCYIKTIFEMNKRYGWSKFIIMVPSIAIREGVYKSMQITADHFMESYGKKARFFIYSSKRLYDLNSFSSDAGINVMVINIQAFNARSRDNRRIYEELDSFQSRKPIDVIALNRPILILDEPQKMEGRATVEALPKFKPLFILRYSATHRTLHNRVHRLDALDAYNQRLVKKIAVCGIQTRGLAGTNAYLYLEAIDISSNDPVAQIEMEVKLNSGEIKRHLRRLKLYDDLFQVSGQLDQYRRFTISQIDAGNDTIEFTNGIVLRTGEPIGDISECDIRRIQIRETIKAHMDKERQLFAKGVKVLSLFFIDKVVKYRDYNADNEKGEYARIFEEEYELLKTEFLSELAIRNEVYRKYLARINPAETHSGYFSIDKNNRLSDPVVGARSVDSDDVNAYDLILKDKERLLSFAEPTRFIFSHSALREGWDNPNVFVICMLKHSDNTISRRQEVGRGLRLSVNKHGDRMDLPSVVHDINVLTVVANESYKDFVVGLQQEIIETLSSRPRQATEAYFTGKMITTKQGSVEVTAVIAKQICRYLLTNGYTDDTDHITDAYHHAQDTGTLAELPEELKPYAEQVFELIDSVLSDTHLPKADDSRKSKTNPLNAKNFERKEFRELWKRINRKAVYRVEFDSEELIDKCVSALDSQLRVTPLQYMIKVGVQNDSLTDNSLRNSSGFTVINIMTEQGKPTQSRVSYDLIGKVAENSSLTRKTVAAVLKKIQPSTFGQFKVNPEHFISSVSRIINEQKSTTLIESLSYNEVDEQYDIDIFTANQTGQDLSRAEKLHKHIYDYAITDSDVERYFVNDLDKSSEIVVYAKLPRGFLIPTPVGDYNPDWAISFQNGSVKHIYFVAETKGTMSSMNLRTIEEIKIKCAKKFFNVISQEITSDHVKYDVVTNYSNLMEIVSPS